MQDVFLAVDAEEGWLMQSKGIEWKFRISAHLSRIELAGVWARG